MTASASAAALPRAKNYLVLQAIAAFFLLVKLIYIVRVGPIMDEAYYWMWGQHPGLSYFDHPPLQGWLLGVVDFLFGRGLIQLRLMTVVTLIGIFYIFQIWAKRLAGEDWQSLFWPGVVIYLASPTFGYFMTLAFHDYLLMFLCLASGHFFLNFLMATDAGEKGKLRDLYLGAVLLGLCGLTKYNGVFLGLGLFFFILAKPSLRTLFRNPHLWIAAAIAIGLQAPVIYWNLSTGLSSYAFHLSERHRDNWFGDFNLTTAIDFPLASAFLVSPFLIPVFFRFFLTRHEIRFEELAKGLAIWTFWLSTVTFFIVSLFDYVFWWWNLVAYILVMPFAAKYMGQRWLFYGHVVFGALVALYLLISSTIVPLSLFYGVNDMRQSRLFGWEELRDAVPALKAEYSPDFIASDGPDLSAIVGFSLDDPAVTALTDRVTQFYYWWQPEAHRGQNALIVLNDNESPAYIASQFEKLTQIDTIRIERFGFPVNGFNIYWAENYQPHDEPGQQGA